MSKSALSTCVVLAALLLSPPANAAGRDVDAMNLSQDWRGFIGKTISVRGCTLTSATPKLAMCLVKSKHGGTTSFLVDPSGMTPDDLAQALRDCSYYVGYRMCRVRLEGEVASHGGELKILHGSVSWTYTP
jgi:hypothetical protein